MCLKDKQTATEWKSAQIKSFSFDKIYEKPQKGASPRPLHVRELKNGHGTYRDPESGRLTEAQMWSDAAVGSNQSSWGKSSVITHPFIWFIHS